MWYPYGEPFGVYCIHYFTYIPRFSAFAAYFLAYNQKNFYQLNEEWENFDSRIGVKKVKNTLDWECENDNNHQDSIVFEMK